MTSQNDRNKILRNFAQKNEKILKSAIFQATDLNDSLKWPQ